MRACFSLTRPPPVTAHDGSSSSAGDRRRAPAVRGLSRSCRLADYPLVPTVAGWQEQALGEGITRWTLAHRRRVAQAYVLNWSRRPFHAPGPSPIYLPDLDLIGMRRIQILVLLNVLDALPAPLTFLQQATARLAPGGLVAATVAYWDATGADCASGAADRKRIYNRDALGRLIHDDLKRVGLFAYGAIDWRYGGDVLGDHTIFALLLTKGGRA